MILLRNIDHLFALPPGFYAVGDCYGGRETGEALRQPTPGVAACSMPERRAKPAAWLAGWPAAGSVTVPACTRACVRCVLAALRLLPQHTG